MNSVCVCTRADKNIEAMSDITHPLMRVAAKKWQADFVVLDGPWKISRHYRILAMRELLESYDAVLNLDTDMVITRSCPNPFTSFDYSAAIATVFEDVGTRREDREKRMELATVVYRMSHESSGIEWSSYYPNTGFFLVPKKCKGIFDTGLHVWNESGYDDVYLGYCMRMTRTPMVSVSFRWNHMTMFSEPWNKSASRFDSYIIHYAGQGIFDKGVKTRMEQIKKDVEKIYGKPGTK